MAALKGAFLNFGAGLLGALPNIIVFQFNPVQVSRTPTIGQPPPLVPAEDGNTNALEQATLPGETMSFSLRVDATDQLAQGNPLAAVNGILPTLCALELMLVPKSSLLIDLGQALGGSTSHLCASNKLPTVLFFWGMFRILPVVITSLSITETEYDTKLNPTRAEVSVNLQVLVPTQTNGDALATGAYKYSQGVKEVMAALNLANAAQLGVSSILSFAG